MRAQDETVEKGTNEGGRLGSAIRRSLNSSLTPCQLSALKKTVKIPNTLRDMMACPPRMPRHIGSIICLPYSTTVK